MFCFSELVPLQPKENRGCGSCLFLLTVPVVGVGGVPVWGVGFQKGNERKPNHILGGILHSPFGPHVAVVFGTHRQKVKRFCFHVLASERGLSLAKECSACRTCRRRRTVEPNEVRLKYPEAYGPRGRDMWDSLDLTQKPRGELCNSYS